MLEIAAGTGVVTRELAATLPADTDLVATDLNPGMLDRAQALGTARPVTWRPADAMQLPFAEGSFDAVVCQFGVMFFPDQGVAFAEARRVLRPVGALLFNVWDRIAENEVAAIIDAAVAALFPTDPPRFMARVPHGYHDRQRIEADLVRGGFGKPLDVTTRDERARAPSARSPAIGFCQGTPLRLEIESRDPTRLAEATDAAERALAQRFGTGPIDGRLRAHVVTVERWDRRWTAAPTSPTSPRDQS